MRTKMTGFHWFIFGWMVKSFLINLVAHNIFWTVWHGIFVAYFIVLWMDAAGVGQ